MNNYNDIINLPHYKSKTRQPMNNKNRAAQFAPFSALTGYDEKIREIARITNKKIILDDNRKNYLNNQIQYINQKLKEKKDFPKVTLTYFVSDKRKEGGEYKTISTYIKRIDEIYKLIILDSNKKILIDDVIDLQ